MSKWVRWKHRLLPLGLALALAIPAFWNLGAGEVRVWDEGLTLRHAHNALEHGRWLTPAGNDGKFSKAFTKPPLLIWQTGLGLWTFGYTPFGARFFTALALVASALVAAALARRSGLSRSAAVAWALLIVGCQGALNWARVVGIEITLVAFSLSALYCYARAMEPSGRRWGLAAAAGVSLGFAFLTKQLVCALPATAIVLTEAFYFRRKEWRVSLLRLGLAGLIPSAVATLWTLLAFSDSTGGVVKSMVRFTIVRRVQGLSNGQHFNHLNRLEHYVSAAFEPFPWELGLLGLGLLWFRSFRTRRPGLVLVTAYLLISILMYDGISRSLLPWYAWSVVVPLYLGLASLLGRTAEDLWVNIKVFVSSTSDAPKGLRFSPECALGVAGLLIATSRLWQLEGSRIVLVLSFLALLPLGALLLRRVQDSCYRWPLVLGLLAWPLGALLYGLSVRPLYHEDPGPIFSLMEPVVESGANRVAVDADIAGHQNLYRGVFGSQAQAVTREPWRNSNRQGFQAYVQALQPPTEFLPRKGTALHRSSGVVAWTGKLDDPPLETDDMADLLDKGALTFEAEFATLKFGGMLTTFDGEDVAAARGLDSDRYKVKANSAVLFTTPTLPPGSYEAVVILASACDPKRGGPVGEVKVELGADRETTLIGCRKDGLYKLSQTLSSFSARSLEVDVRYRAGDLWVDKLIVQRTSSKAKRRR